MYLQMQILCIFCSFAYVGSSSVLDTVLVDDVQDIFGEVDILVLNNSKLNEINRKLDSIIDILSKISTSNIEASNICSKDDVPKPSSCADLRQGGASFNGVYYIFPRGLGRAVKVVCDMTTNGGGWTVFLRRGNYSGRMTSFERNWMDYKNGFGDTEGEYWLGNDVLHSITSEDVNLLRIHATGLDGNEAEAEIGDFAVGNESSHYTLHIGGAARDSDNLWFYHDNLSFSTYDRAVQKNKCAVMNRSGWWFNMWWWRKCYSVHFTGKFYQQDAMEPSIYGIKWAYGILGVDGYLESAALMIRPRNFKVSD